ncbi:MAG: hypothetical protein B6244_09120 [Candidatus Cloacimonetes bacterium 4572_55]|nr:MAG: hypothetical protein B6244_09120 [Candidatus Cloacimonetes bacterium 4572_55]
MWGKVYDDDGEVSWDFIGQFMTQIGLDEAVFVDADTVLVHGVVKNRLSVGSSGDMYLMDDIYYVDSMSRYGSINQGKPLDGCEDYLGLISEGDILIADIFWPGRTEPTPAPTGYPNRHDIVIDAGIVTLGESFTVHCGDQPGERGDIHMWGALAQKRRGVVHTIDKCPNPQMIYTGYGKDYHYDQRFQYWPPPYYLNTNSGKGGSTTHTLWRNRKIKGDYGF